MKCNASPITSTAPSVRDVAAEFEGMLLAKTFAPLAQSLGFFGDAVVACVGRDLARRQSGGLADRLATALEPALRASAMRGVP